MKTRKSVYFIAIVSILFLLLSGCTHRRWNAERFSGHVLEHMDDQVDDLNLNEEQTAQYQQIRAKMEADLSSIHLNHSEAMLAQHEKINQENPDITSLTGVFRERLKTAPNEFGTFLDRFEEFYNILNEEQQAEVLEEFRQKINRRID